MIRYPLRSRLATIPFQFTLVAVLLLESAYGLPATVIHEDGHSEITFDDGRTYSGDGDCTVCESPPHSGNSLCMKKGGFCQFFPLVSSAGSSGLDVAINQGWSVDADEASCDPDSCLPKVCIPSGSSGSSNQPCCDTYAQLFSWPPVGEEAQYRFRDCGNEKRECIPQRVAVVGSGLKDSKGKDLQCCPGLVARGQFCIDPNAPQTVVYVGGGSPNSGGGRPVTCTPQCSGVCNVSDGCGGTCAGCPQGQVCGVNHRCLSNTGSGCRGGCSACGCPSGYQCQGTTGQCVKQNGGGGAGQKYCKVKGKCVPVAQNISCPPC